MSTELEPTPAESSSERQNLILEMAERIGSWYECPWCGFSGSNPKTATEHCPDD